MSRFGYLIGAAILGWLVVPASADTIANFTLNGVTFNDGGTATGGFTLDLTTSTLLNVNIVTSTNSPLGDTYTFGAFSNSPASFDFIDDFAGPEGYDRLVLTLSAALTDSDLSSSNSFSLASGFEVDVFFLCGGVCAGRSVTAGSLDAVPSATPLPAALPLFAGGAGLIGLLARRRKRKNHSAIPAA